MKHRWLTLLSCLLFSINFNAAAQGAQENLVLRIPGLNAFNARLASWAIYRNPIIWSQGEILDLRKIPLPIWDKKQDPVALIVPPASENIRYRIHFFNAEKNATESQDFTKPWAAVNYSEKQFYQIEILVGARFILKTDVFPSPKPKYVLECEAPVSEDPIAFKKNRRLALCLESIKAVASESDQWFAEVQWPRVPVRDTQTLLTGSEREIKHLYTKGKHLYRSTRSKDLLLTAKIGRTYFETLVDPKIDFVFENGEIATLAPSATQTAKSLMSFAGLGKSSIEVLSLPGDQVQEFAIKDSTHFSPPIFLQVIGGDETTGFQFQKTDFARIETGAIGLLRPWMLSYTLPIHSLWSGRNEKVAYLGSSQFDGSFFWKQLELYPSFFLGRDLFALGSDLSITQVKFDIAKRIKSSSDFFPFIGFEGYALSGSNPGSSRLGSVAVIPVGIKLHLPAGNSFWTSRIAAHLSLGGVSPSVGYSATVRFGQFFSGKREGFYWGVNASYTRYSAKLLNAVLNEETFAEDLIQAGFTLGWAGLDFWGVETN